jgi:putative redox protein
MELLLQRKQGDFGFEVHNRTGNSIRFDASDDIGGQGFGVRPMEALASSLAACASIDVLLILKKQKKEPKNFEVKIEAIRKNGVPSIFESIHLEFLVESTEKEKLNRAIELSLEKYCSVAKILAPTCTITFSLELINPS